MAAQKTTAGKKSVAKKVPAKKTTTASKKIPAKKATAKKPVAKKVSAKKKVNLAALEATGEKAFYVKDGSVVSVLGDLVSYIEKMSDEVYDHHVNENGNDFSNWIRDVFGRKLIANKVAKAANRAATVKILKASI